MTNDIDIKSIRSNLKMSQKEFADFLGSNAKTLHKWEQKTSRPSAAARTLLLIAANRPDIIREVMLGKTPDQSRILLAKRK